MDLLSPDPAGNVNRNVNTVNKRFRFLQTKHGILLHCSFSIVPTAVAHVACAHAVMTSCLSCSDGQWLHVKEYEDYNYAE